MKEQTNNRLNEVRFYMKQRLPKYVIAKTMNMSQPAVAYYIERYKLKYPKIKLYK